MTTIICKELWKNCGSSGKAVTISKTLTEYTMRSCTTIAPTIAVLKTYDLMKLGNSNEKKLQAQTTA